MTSSSQRLTKYPTASMREVVSLSFTYMLIFFSGSFMGLCDRIILAHSSLNALEASVSALFLVQLFQIPTIRIVSVAQTYIAQYKGANQNSHIGLIIWQMIWFSLILMLFILPISIPISHFFFKNSIIQRNGLSYFQYLIHANFLFTIGAALSCFYLGQGKPKKVLITSIFSQIINLFLDLAFVFGIKGWISPMGAKGAALASAIAEFFFCAILLSDFLKQKYRHLYGTGNFAFKKSLFFQSLKLGIPQGFSRFMALFSIIGMNYVILQKTDLEYLAVFSFGSSLILFANSFHDGLCRSITTIGGYIIGAKKPLIWQLARSSFFFLIVLSISLVIPCLFFQNSIIGLFFKEELSIFLMHELHLSLYWICVNFFTYGLVSIGYGLINAYGDPKFQMIYSSFFTLTACLLPVYLTIGIGNMAPHVYWIIMGCHCIPAAMIFYFRLCQEKWKISSIVSEDGQLQSVLTDK